MNSYQWAIASGEVIKPMVNVLFNGDRQSLTQATQGMTKGAKAD